MTGGRVRGPDGDVSTAHGADCCVVLGWAVDHLGTGGDAAPTHPERAQAVALVMDKRKGPTRAELEPEPEQIAGAPPAPLQVASDLDLKVFMLACLLRAIGNETPAPRSIYASSAGVGTDATAGRAGPLDIRPAVKAVCDGAGIRMRKEGNEVVCVNVRLAA